MNRFDRLIEQIDEAAAELRSARTVAERESTYTECGETGGPEQRKAITRLTLTLQVAQMVLANAESELQASTAGQVEAS